jgi:hypothetical protein
MTIKIVTLLEKNLPSGVALNVSAHMGLGLAADAAANAPSTLAAMNFQQYRDGDGFSYPFISALPLIVLRAKAGEIRWFHDECHRYKLLNIAFVSDMTGGTYLEQMERLSKRPRSEVAYFGVCAIGDRAILDPLTRKFSLWKQPERGAGIC